MRKLPPALTEKLVGLVTNTCTDARAALPLLLPPCERLKPMSSGDAAGGGDAAAAHALARLSQLVQTMILEGQAEGDNPEGRPDI